MNNTELESSYERINANLSKMDLPINRKDASRGHNLQWLMRNVGVRNSNHPLCAETIKLLAQVGRAAHQLRACDVDLANQGKQNGNPTQRTSIGSGGL